jgi:hypothetical protein
MPGVGSMVLVLVMAAGGWWLMVRRDPPPPTPADWLVVAGGVRSAFGCSELRAQGSGS